MELITYREQDKDGLMSTFIDCADPSQVAPRRRTATSFGAQTLLALSIALQQWRNRSAQRRILAGMSDAHLKDIGLSRADVEGEVAKHFWQQ